MPAANDPLPEEPLFEDIGRGVIDDGASRGFGSGFDGGLRGSGFDGRFESSGPDGGAPDDDAGAGARRPAAFGAVREAWRDARPAFASVRFWFTVLCGLLFAIGGSMAVAAWGASDGWFASDSGGWLAPAVGVAGLFLAAALLAVVAAVLGVRWGFHSAHPYLAPVLGGVLGAGVRGLAFALPAGLLLLGYGLVVGTPAAVVPAVGVMVFEFFAFGAIGAGARACFAGTLPGGVLAWLLAAAMCVGNVVAMAMLLPGTLVDEPASVAVNVKRDSIGRYTYYECIGEPVRSETVLHSERVAWLGAMHPSVLFGTVAVGSVPVEEDLAWVLDGMQWASEGPAWDVPCLNGASSEELPTPMPLALIGWAGQLGVAAVVTVPGLLLARRRAHRG
ncbi:hypothetical protein [Arthrobacter sp. CJ23]|uniref:hypothetical protein n=1 Tax=Arthrobacter sp. CJ23 TaxID=2972479 RepID=UPI00215BDFBE|nr:hypothetical protein [Arthrobacter sp. CJ23]UVJ40099.1 hypothetical protein NVV90_02585 [Arthrobacter sp. CJ23]